MNTGMVTAKMISCASKADTQCPVSLFYNVHRLADRHNFTSQLDLLSPYRTHPYKIAAICFSPIKLQQEATSTAARSSSSMVLQRAPK